MKIFYYVTCPLCHFVLLAAKVHRTVCYFAQNIILLHILYIICFIFSKVKVLKIESKFSMDCNAQIKTKLE